MYASTCIRDVSVGCMEVRSHRVSNEGMQRAGQPKRRLGHFVIQRDSALRVPHHDIARSGTVLCWKGSLHLTTRLMRTLVFAVLMRARW